MLPQDLLIGILFSSCKNSITIVQSSQTKFGYKVHLSSSIRHDIETLIALQRTLLQHQIESKIIEKESKAYPKPILRITKIANLKNLDTLMQDSKIPKKMMKKWSDFSNIVSIISRKQHYTTKGFDQLVCIKEAGI